MEILILVSKNSGIVSKDELKELAQEIRKDANVEVLFYT